MAAPFRVFEGHIQLGAPPFPFFGRVGLLTFRPGHILRTILGIQHEPSVSPHP